MSSKKIVSPRGPGLDSESRPRQVMPKDTQSKRDRGFLGLGRRLEAGVGPETGTGSAKWLPPMKLLKGSVAEVNTACGGRYIGL